MDYKEISIYRYLREYCDMKWNKFLRKKLRKTFVSDAWYDIIYYYDDENKLIIVDRMYLGD